jgi:hypothetical protein
MLTTLLFIRDRFDLLKVVACEAERPTLDKNLAGQRREVRYHFTKGKRAHDALPRKRISDSDLRRHMQTRLFSTQVQFSYLEERKIGTTQRARRSSGIGT